MWIFLVSILSPVLGLSALISENSVQTEGGKHLCTLCGKVVRAIRQHIRGCSQVKRCMVILLVDRRLVAAFASLPDNLATVQLTPCLTVGESFPGRALVRGAVLLLPLLQTVQELEARVQAARVRIPSRLEGGQAGHIRCQEFELSSRLIIVVM